MRLAKGCMLTAAVGMLVFGAVARADTIYFAWEVTDPVTGLAYNTPTFSGDPQQEGKPLITKIEWTPDDGVTAIPYSIWVAIDPGTDGPSSQGMASFTWDIGTDTGLLQPTLTFSKTKTSGPQTVTSNDWTTDVSGYGVQAAGFGFNLLSQVGNNSSTIGWVKGPGSAMSLIWNNDVSTYTPGLQPEALHNVGYGAPPGTDVGGYPTPPATKARDKWYLMDGTINVDGLGLGSYYVQLIPGGCNIIDLTADLNQHIDTGFQAGTIGNGDTLLGAGWWFNIIPEPATLSALLFAGVGLVIRRRR